MKLLSWQTALLIRLILAMTLLFIVPIGVASAIGNTISAPLIVMQVTRVDRVRHNYLYLLDTRTLSRIQLHNAVIGNNSVGMWSPDGTQIVYQDTKNQSFTWNITSDTRSHLAYPYLSPPTLVWSRENNAILMYFSQNEHYEIYLVQPNQNDFRLLMRLANNPMIQGDVSLSPDGRFVIFSGYDSDQGNTNIYRFDILEEKLTQLTDNPEGNNLGVRLSPDGQQIAYWTSNLGGELEISVMNVDGSDQRQIIASYDIRGRLQWSPDGTQLLFLDAAGSNIPHILNVVNINSGEQKRLVDRVSSYDLYAWSPDGKYILYIVDKPDKDRDLYIIPADGGEPRLLYSKDTTWISTASWQPQP
jgi:Tol biopolymer transport system component